MSSNTAMIFCNVVIYKTEYYDHIMIIRGNIIVNGFLSVELVRM